MKFKMVLFLILILSNNVFATADLKLTKISENIYAIVGELTNRSATNLGNNASFGFIITTKGVVLIDSGGSFLGAKRIHDLIKTVTDKPIVYVINTGGQDHRWFGNGYFKQQGAVIISSKNASIDHKARFTSQYNRLESLMGQGAIAGTQALTADITFDEEYTLDMGDMTLELYHRGQAHTPGDTFVWLPLHHVIFTGDIVYITRMLGVGSQSSSKSWVTVFEAMAQLKPKILVPGHGAVTTLKKATQDTYSYLIELRKKVSDFIDNDGDLSEISTLDWSSYQYLQNSESLSNKNASKVFTELEWE